MVGITNGYFYTCIHINWYHLLNFFQLFYRRSIECKFWGSDNIKNKACGTESVFVIRDLYPIKNSVKMKKILLAITYYRKWNGICFNRSATFQWSVGDSKRLICCIICTVSVLNWNKINSCHLYWVVITFVNAQRWRFCIACQIYLTVWSLSVFGIHICRCIFGVKTMVNKLSTRFSIWP